MPLFFVHRFYGYRILHTKIHKLKCRGGHYPPICHNTVGNAVLSVPKNTAPRRAAFPRGKVAFAKQMIEVFLQKPEIYKKLCVSGGNIGPPLRRLNNLHYLKKKKGHFLTKYSRSRYFLLVFFCSVSVDMDKSYGRNCIA